MREYVGGGKCLENYWASYWLTGQASIPVSTNASRSHSVAYTKGISSFSLEDKGGWRVKQSAEAKNEWNLCTRLQYGLMD
jgi:hypothetical protein